MNSFTEKTLTIKAVQVQKILDIETREERIELLTEAAAHLTNALTELSVEQHEAGPKQVLLGKIGFNFRL